MQPGILGRYKILGELGRGGCGVVYRALDPSIGRMVAIKTILAKSESPTNQESRERFRREARSAGNLSHPNIVTVHDFSDTGDPMYIAMEFVEGRTLAAAMSGGPLPLDFILKVLRAAAGALDYAHTQHIVHRDVKPANFLIDKSDRLKITDFGIAKILDSEEGLTSTGMVVGTVQYMSPEQISETRVTGRSDQFSLAVIAYELLTGVKPFQGNSWASVIHAIIMSEPASVTQFRDTLHESANAVLRKALSKDPEARYATCSQFVEALEQAILGATIERTAIYTKPMSAVPAGTAKHESTPVLDTNPIQSAQIPIPPTRKKSILKPVLIGAIGGAVIAAGLWLGLRSTRTEPAAPTVAQQTTPQVAQQPQPVQTPPAPVLQPTPHPQIETTPPPRTRPTPKQIQAQPTAEPAARQSETAKATPPPVEIAPVAPPPPVVVAPKIPVPTPTPVSAPVKPQEDQAKRAADEQAKQLLDQQAKRAADDRTRRAAEEQANNARIADNAAISRSLMKYSEAYERKDPAALQAIWPSIPKPVLEGIRSSFREASEVTMELHQVGDPKIAGAVATVICDRNVHQVILKRALQASSRVRIVLVRSGAGWMIQSVDPVSQ